MWYMRQKEEFGEDRSQGIRFYDNTQTCDYLPHWHMPYEVIMVIAEDLTVIVENERHLLHPGDIMVIPSGVVHEIHTPPTGQRYYFLLDRERLFIIDGLLAAEEALQPCMVIRKGSAPEIEQRVKNAAAEAGVTQDRFGLTVARLELSRMLIDLLRRHAQEHGTELNRRVRHKEQTQMLFVDIRDYVMAHCAEDLTPQNMADKSGYSRYHFERLFYDCLGISFHEFLIRQRLTLCKQLLERTDDSITSMRGSRVLAALRHSTGFSSSMRACRPPHTEKAVLPNQNNIGEDAHEVICAETRKTAD